jgi:hypothetical protein
MRRRGFAYCSAVLGLLASTPARADIYCHGLVLNVQVQPAGDLWVDWGFGLVDFCNVNVDFAQAGQTYGFKTCQSMLSIAMTAQASGKELWVRFPNDTNCNLNAGGYVGRNVGSFAIK